MEKIKTIISALLVKAGVTVAGAMFPCAVVAQVPQEVRSIVEESHDSLWYASQMDAWGKVAEREPKNEKAWRNMMRAVLYKNRGHDGEEVAETLQRMEAAIPGTYTYHLCAYRANRSPHNEDAETALRLMPADATSDDYNDLMCYLWMNGCSETTDENNARFSAFAKKLFELGHFPSPVMRYCYNQLVSMDDDAIYFGNGDACVIPMVMLQKGLNVHEDKTVIPICFLMLEEYRQALFGRLGIPPYTGVKDCKKERETVDAIIMHIIKSTKRPAYFFAGDANARTDSLRKYLYGEGLLFKYSERRYNNMAVARRNFEKVYHLDYLTEPSFVPERRWEASEYFNLNHVMLFSSLIKSYDNSGDKERADALRYMLNTICFKSNLPDSKKEYYIKYIDDIAKK